MGLNMMRSISEPEARRDFERHCQQLQPTQLWECWDRTIKDRATTTVYVIIVEANNAEQKQWRVIKLDKENVARLIRGEPAVASVVQFSYEGLRLINLHKS